MKHKRLIHVQMIMDVEVHLGVVRVLLRSQEADILNVSEVSL